MTPSRPGASLIAVLVSLVDWQNHGAITDDSNVAVKQSAAVGLPAAGRIGFRISADCFTGQTFILKLISFSKLFDFDLLFLKKKNKQVNIGSLAEAAGLKAGDAILRVNQVDVMRLRHQEALDIIARAGNQFQLYIGR